MKSAEVKTVTTWACSECGSLEESVDVRSINFRDGAWWGFAKKTSPPTGWQYVTIGEQFSLICPKHTVKIVTEGANADAE